MTRTRYKFLPDDPFHPYFLTITTVNWLPLFSNPEIVSILIKSLLHLIVTQQLTLYAYVIMENHLHLIASAPDLQKQVTAFKSYTAHQCIAYYKSRNNRRVLDLLASSKLQFKVDRIYQFWQEGSHPQRIESEAMFTQKVEYIHQNPVRRGYIALPEHWCYSSARNYAGLNAVLPIADGQEE